ncbi:hypothetical protein DGMP_01220 [Desulfomarina profundi]|uniref:Serine acetyltransferase n=1 Tax=Desulfomarina profundi TaxID=2772557 RepID=A0A8D5FJP5_9BACT|nr:hypothetical protein [Desulfomarina profundi]BCL59429.1 hypothetical protein DGMP_01220 [Desulfomarina profundi]
MNKKKYPSLLKLKQDIRRYLTDLDLNLSIKLIFIIDFWPVLLLRLEELTLELNRFPGSLLNIVLLFLRPFIQGMSGTRIFNGAQLGEGFLIHTSVGVVITAEAVIGTNCTVFSGASVVHSANNKGEGAATIGDNVKLMNGCKVIGPVNIGNNVIVASNAVVLQDIPGNSIAVGIPAVIKVKNS